LQPYLLSLLDALPILSAACLARPSGNGGLAGLGAAPAPVLRAILHRPTAGPAPVARLGRTAPGAVAAPMPRRACNGPRPAPGSRSEEHTSELQSREKL